jgi:hypothetical protein
LPVWFWIVAALALLWNLAGIYAYWSHVTLSDEALAALTEAQRSMYLGMPAWATAAFAIAVFGGVAASLALVFRSRFSVALFGISLAAVVVQMFQAFVLANALNVMGASAAIMPSTIIVIAIAMLWFSTMARGKGWLR